MWLVTWHVARDKHVICTRFRPGHLSVCVGLFVCCLTSQQHASVSQGRICTDNLTCCYTEIEVEDQTFYLTQSQYQSQRWLYNASVDTVVPIFKSLVWLDPEKSRRKRDSNPGSAAPVCVGDSLWRSEEIVKNLKFHLWMRLLLLSFILR